MPAPQIKKSDRRSPAEWAFLAIFFPATVLFYMVYKYPEWLVADAIENKMFIVFGKRYCS